MMKRMLMEKERSMLSCVGLSQELWVESINNTCYLVNQSPTLVFIDKTFHEVCSSKKPCVVHHRYFGFHVFVHVPKEKRELDNKANKCIFIWHKDGMRGFKLQNLMTKKTIYVTSLVTIFKKNSHDLNPISYKGLSTLFLHIQSILLATHYQNYYFVFSQLSCYSIVLSYSSPSPYLGLSLFHSTHPVWYGAS